ncbi:hypothetical protein PIB30_006914 [Stylosanthes scabra]|uniref:Replication protein A 70 kDa DNA-binding subunit B/D first OB fold domain-containing protein n=1 Tax=Stylosanthes scabra TaxID=79078 RepID=A0ABU6X3I3_9FABA|nr:hypothetical protein [Stylosanthes scabra]
MALTTDFLEDVGAKKFGWCFNVYLIRLWEEPDKNNEEKINSIDMVIQDIKGTRVQGSIPDSLFKQWRGKLEEFKILLGDNPSTIVHIGQISSGSSVRYVDEIKRGKSIVKTIEEVAKSTEKCGMLAQLWLLMVQG